jgi:hypothetical protein
MLRLINGPMDADDEFRLQTSIKDLIACTYEPFDEEEQHAILTQLLSVREQIESSMRTVVAKILQDLQITDGNELEKRLPAVLQAAASSRALIDGRIQPLRLPRDRDAIFRGT